jgi:hypothetical protein
MTQMLLKGMTHRAMSAWLEASQILNGFKGQHNVVPHSGTF